MSYSSITDPIEVWNKFVFCPQCGHKSLSVENSKKLICSNCEFCYFINPVSSVLAVIKNDEDKVLSTRRKFEPAVNKLDFPGGFVDFNESLEDALRREIHEELSIELDQIDYFGSYQNRYPYQNILYYPLDAIFFCTVKDWSGLKANDDVAEICFIHPSQVNPDEMGFPSGRNVLKNLQAF